MTWIAFKVGGTDVAPDTETQHCYDRWRARGLSVGAWTYCAGPPQTDAMTMAAGLRFGHLDFYVYDVESAYKTDEAGPGVAGWPAQLVKVGGKPSAVTSYGAIPGYGNSPSSIDFAAFADAGWPILAQCYDSFKPGDEQTYSVHYPAQFPGPYAAAGIHRLLRDLTLLPGQAVYRPESIDPVPA